MKKISFILPSLEEIFFLIILLGVTISGASLLSDGDTGYHIRAGEYILQTGSIPKEDIFSYLSPPPEWTAHEWLAEVIMAIVHHFSGLTGVVIFYSILISFSFYLFFILLHKTYENILILWIFVLFSTLCTAIHWLARPHVFSFLNLILWYLILNAFEYRDKNYLYCLPIIMLFWVNLHGGYIIGCVLLVIYFSVNLFVYILGEKEQREKNWKKVKSYFKIGIICLIVGMINPYGYNIYFFPFKLINNQIIMSSITEFMPTNFQEPLLFRYLFLLSLLIIIIFDCHKKPIEIILIILFTYMALYSVRYTTLFSIVITPIILSRLNCWVENSKSKKIIWFRKIEKNIAKANSSLKVYRWPTISVIVLITLVKIGIINYDINSKLHPVEAVKFLLEENISGNMFNNDEFGDYIIYAAYPKYKVFFDGRSDMYGSEYLKNYRKVIFLEKGWENILIEKNIGWIIYNSDSALSRCLYEKQNWHLIYSDGVADIFVKNIHEYNHLIGKYKDVKPEEINEKKEKNKLIKWIF